MKHDAKRRERLKGRSGEIVSFAGVPREVMNTRKYRALSAPAKVLLFELCRQYCGSNNGNLCVAWGVVKDRGCGTHTTVQKAAKELENAGMIERTEQGGRHKPNLYALTWKAIDDCGVRVSFSPRSIPSGLWKDVQSPLPSVQQAPEIERPYPQDGHALTTKQVNRSFLTNTP